MTLKTWSILLVALGVWLKVLFAYAEPVCEKWMRECHREAFAERHCAGWTDVCTKWHETAERPTPVPTVAAPVATETLDYKSGQIVINPDVVGYEKQQFDVKGRLIISNKSDAEALKALGLKMCEGR